mgnify:CR=1 FL=1
MCVLYENVYCVNVFTKPITTATAAAVSTRPPQSLKLYSMASVFLIVQIFKKKRNFVPWASAPPTHHHPLLHPHLPHQKSNSKSPHRVFHGTRPPLQSTLKSSKINERSTPLSRRRRRFRSWNLKYTTTRSYRINVSSTNVSWVSNYLRYRLHPPPPPTYLVFSRIKTRFWRFFSRLPFVSFYLTSLRTRRNALHDFTITKNLHFFVSCGINMFCIVSFWIVNHVTRIVRSIHLYLVR